MLKIMRSTEKEVEKIYKRTFEYSFSVEESVKNILRSVNEKGEKAVFFFTKKYDNADINSQNFKVTKEEIAEAYSKADEKVVSYLIDAYKNIKAFHEKQKTHSWLEKDNDGNLLGQVHQPLVRVGIYVPGGTASYPSSVLMNAVPAVVAGVKEVIMVTPPSPDGKINPYSLIAADISGIKEIYKVGGVQAIGALAYGTESLEPVDKITGPGNIYVTVAKKEVYGIVDIDMLAGPSEILIIADKFAKPEYVASDMLSQAEHDILAAAILVTPDFNLAEKVSEELSIQLKKLKRQDIALKAIENNCAAIITQDLKEAIEIANRYAPEHLELLVKEPFQILPEIKNAGSIFMGEWSPEPVGDYFAGPNHILPTGGTARFYSPVTVDTFMKKSSIIYYKKESLQENGKKIIKLAETEGLDAHANAVRIRLADLEG